MTDWPLLSSLVAEICNYMKEIPIEELSSVVIKAFNESEFVNLTITRRRIIE